MEAAVSQALKFEVIHTSSKSRARVGKIHTPHGVIHTPSFVAVGTNASIKALSPDLLAQIDLDLMFCNTYHLMLQPGTDVVEKAGGLHAFMQRDKPIITDSGGFQVFSLAYGSVADELKSRGQKKVDGHVLKISEDGVWFRSYRDGSKMLLTPETSVAAQKQLGADIIIPFDELPPYHLDPKELVRSFDRTHRWEKRSLDAHKKDPRNQAMYAVVHGGVDKALRKKSAQILTAQGFDGYSIGGSVGKTREEMWDLVEYTAQCLPTECPIHLLGVGDLPSIKECIPSGIDTFDSSYPTKCARHGVLLTREAPVKIGRRVFANDFGPPVRGCSCSTCQNTSMAYLHHLFKARELSGLILATVHNLHTMCEIMKNYRNMILEDRI